MLSSLRGKILLAYGLLAALGATLVLFAWGDLRYLEQRLGEGEAVATLHADALDMRRHEKNYFLYKDLNELFAAQTLADGLSRNLEAHAGLLASLGRPGELAQLQTALGDYHRHIEAQLQVASDAATDEAMERSVRNAGHLISQQAERLRQRERAAVVEALHASGRALFAIAATVILLGVFAGHLIARALLRPLRALEAELQPLAEGRFDAFHAPSQDREIVSLTQALNRMLQELDARRRQVLQSDKLASLGVLASGVAHELNNPLGNISASAQILGEEIEQPSWREWLTQIDTETERARRIVRTLLDYARRSDFRPEPIPLEEVVEKSLLLLGRQRPDPEAISIVISPDLAVQADEQRLQQVFINLLRNAVDAAGPEARLRIAARQTTWARHPPGLAAVVIGALPEDVDAPIVRIDIEDNGPGIAPDALAHVFDPFFTTREPGQGTGLGLYVVEEIVSEHGGRIAVENLARGVRFSIWLPCPGEVPNP